MQSNEEMVREYQNGNEAVISQLWENNLGLIRIECKDLARCYEYDDLMQEAFIALIFAVKDYQPDSDYTFATHLKKRVRWHLLRYIQSTRAIHISYCHNTELVKYMKAVDDLQKRLGRLPDTEELCSRLSCEPADIRQYESTLQMLKVNSLDAPVNEDDDGGSAMDFISDQNDQYAEVERCIDNSIAAADLRFALDRLPAVWKEDIIAHYCEDKTFESIGKERGATRAAVCMRVKKGMDRLRESSLLKRNDL